MGFKNIKTLSLSDFENDLSVNLVQKVTGCVIKMLGGAQNIKPLFFEFFRYNDTTMI